MSDLYSAIMAAERRFENIEEKLAKLDDWAQKVEGRLVENDGKLSNLIGQLDVYAKEQTAWKEDLAGAVRAEIGRVTGSLGELYANVERHIRMFDERINRAERSERKEKSPEGLLHRKDMKPSILEKDEHWRRWKSDVEDYSEETYRGMKDMLDKVRDAEGAVGEAWFTGADEQWWSKGEPLYRFLKRYVGGEARRVVLGVGDDNGWEAWRRLHQQFEPASVTREAMVLAKYTNMVNRKAKTPKETKALMNELDERAKRVEEVTGTPVESRHAMSVIAGLLDPETSKHTAQYQGAKSNVETLRRKVLEFTNLVTAHDTNKMDLDMVQEHQSWADETWDEEEDLEALNAFGEKCHNCGGVGHYARECPSRTKGKSKGKGKDGKGKGETKGSGKGKGVQTSPSGGKGKGKAVAPQFGTCWTCGGAHFARDCPKASNASAKGGGKGEIKVLSSISEHKSQTVSTSSSRSSGIAVRNRFAPLAAIEEEREETEAPGAAWVQVGSRSRKAGVEMSMDTRGHVPCDRPQKPTRRRWGSSSLEQQQLGTLVEVTREGVRSVEEQEWEEVDLAVDSGATETVINEDMLQSVDIQEGDALRRGVQYEVASGELIPNLGEKKFVGTSDEGAVRNLTAQVCDVNKALLSVKKTVQAGNPVVFDPAGSYIEDIASGEKLSLKERGGMYMLKLWVKRGFQGQAQ